MVLCWLWPLQSWDKVKLLAHYVDMYEWLVWVPLGSLFVDSAAALDSLFDQTHTHLILPQDDAGDGAGAGLLTEPLVLRGKSEWSRTLLATWWSFSGSSYSGDPLDALGRIVRSMDEEERVPPHCREPSIVDYSRL